MSERTSYAPGTPFYAELFGWEVSERPDSDEMGATGARNCAARTSPG